jgi:hypothetical protein
LRLGQKNLQLSWFNNVAEAHETKNLELAPDQGD